MIDLHVTSEGQAHIVVDADGTAILANAPLSGGWERVPVFMQATCPCPYQVPPHASVSLLGFVIGTT